MPLQTATDIASLIDPNDADEFVLADGCTFLGHLTQGYSESLEIPGRRPVILAISADVVGISVGTTVDLDPYKWTIQHIEQGDRLSRLFLEKRG